MRGIAFKELGDYEQAFTNLTKAIDSNPDYVYAYNSRGYLSQIQGDYDQAISDYTKAIEVAPTDPYAYSGRAYSNLKQGKESLALLDILSYLNWKAGGLIQESPG